MNGAPARRRTRTIVDWVSVAPRAGKFSTPAMETVKLGVLTWAPRRNWIRKARSPRPERTAGAVSRPRLGIIARERVSMQERASRDRGVEGAIGNEGVKESG